MSAAHPFYPVPYPKEERGECDRGRGDGERGQAGYDQPLAGVFDAELPLQYTGEPVVSRHDGNDPTRHRIHPPIKVADHLYLGG